MKFTAGLTSARVAALLAAIPAGFGAVSLGQAQAASGIGAAWSSYAQQGAAGSIGGIYKIGGGLGGTPGTNLSGATQIDLGAAVANVSAKCSVLVGGSSVLDVSQTGASVTTIGSGQGIVVSAPSGAIGLTTGGTFTVSSANYTDIESSNVIYFSSGVAARANSIINWRSQGDALSRIDTVPDTGANSMIWQANVSSVKLSQIDNTTNSTTAAPWTIQAPNATGTTAVGGTMNIGPGTGTSSNGLLNLLNLATTTSAPSAGGAGALPATPAGYASISINGTPRKVAYY